MVLQSSCYWAVFQIGSSSREDYFRCWQNSFSCSCRTEVLFSCRLLTRSHSWVLELNSDLSPCGSLIIWQFTSSKPTKESLSLQYAKMKSYRDNIIMEVIYHLYYHVLLVQRKSKISKSRGLYKDMEAHVCLTHVVCQK